MRYFLESDIIKILDNTSDISSFFSNKSILLTGGNGFLGKYFIEIFSKYNETLRKPLNLTVLDNSFKKNKITKHIKLIKKDVSKPFNIKKKFDIIIHAAGIASPFYYRKKPIETLDVTIQGIRNCLNLAKKNKSKLIYFSTSEIYGDPPKIKVPTNEDYRGNVSTMGPRACYDESKRLGETFCYIYNNYFNVHTNIIRPFNVYGPGMKQKDYRIFPNFISNILNNKQLYIYGSGNQTRTYCYITDAIEGFIRVIVLGYSGTAYNIGNNKPEISVKKIISILKRIHNKKIRSKIISYPKSYPSDEPLRRCPDINKAKKHLNYQPKVTLEEGLKKYLKWAEKNYKF
ncbi:MAG: dTDP-4-oxo-6-deoxy-D-allose reductase [Alphaproteobacteria bacterium MarineAlpha5_Bin8]|nr:MAG: dTDP-4-oxo-6-deoxy-D-allose reductase [Alphaproteobacteria bacterium MarineAlpha5_Bin8]PPR46219.1 MAG: dTDP-4-oxo-6-deoxy-D-allose reductase [Alphaproteobacteria bacterium MarineAlpha5_Bin7]PPR55023.1 MAG: dTDP-4-oxo-6-deoxy-D-allose reductase [Alphaproteobacteria bacterium MarineAlpha5_Bin6]|tara:strand:- start:445 stop:1476 length:1032 start_codon:yes stop_codon:yes gene_type:complete